MTKKSLSKKDLIVLLEDNVKLQPQVMTAAIETHCASPDGMPVQDPPSSLAGWFYLKCVRAKIVIDTDRSARELACLVLKTIEGIPEDEEDIPGKALTLLYAAVDKVGKRMNEEFIMDVSKKTKDLLDNEGVSEEALMEREANVLV